MADPQWNMLYWIWSQSAEVRLAVSGGQPLFTLGLAMFALSLEHLLPLLWGPSSNLDFLFMSKMLFEGHKQKNPCTFKTGMGFVGKILIKLETYFIWGFLQLLLSCPLGSSLCKHAGGQSKITEVSTSLAWVCVVWRSESSMELSAPCWETLLSLKNVHYCTKNTTGHFGHI